MAKTKTTKIYKPSRTINWDNVTNKIKESEKKVTYQNDDGYSENLYTPKLKEDGSFQAVIRLLPRPESDGDGVPFIKLMNHGFQDVGGWYIENCPTTIGQKCPVCISNGKDWKAGNQEIASARGRRTSYYTNIQVVNDPQTPENNGKTFIFRYGKKIHDKIMEKIAPSDDSIDEPVQVFDLVEGQNFKLKIKKVTTTIRGQQKSYNNYDDSNFSGQTTAIVENKEQEDELFEKLFELSPITAEDKFKDFSELESKFNDKIGADAPVHTSKPSTTTVAKDTSTSEPEMDDADTDADFLKKIREEG